MEDVDHRLLRWTLGPGWTRGLILHIDEPVHEWRCNHVPSVSYNVEGYIVPLVYSITKKLHRLIRDAYHAFWSSVRDEKTILLILLQWLWPWTLVFSRTTYASNRLQHWTSWEQGLPDSRRWKRWSSSKRKCMENPQGSQRTRRSRLRVVVVEENP